MDGPATPVRLSDARADGILARLARLLDEPLDVPLRCAVRIVRRPLRRPFRIARGARNETCEIHVRLDGDGIAGTGAAVPYPRYGETPETAHAALAPLAEGIGAAESHRRLLERIADRAARAALDAALWEWRARRAGRRIGGMLDLPDPPRCPETAFTIGLDAPKDMANAAKQARTHRLLKLKLGGDDPARDRARIEAVRGARPDACIIVDANESCSAQALPGLMRTAHAAGVPLVEQPLPADGDEALESLPPRERRLLCADESFLGEAGEIDWHALSRRYGTVNVKLEKAGGFSAALALAITARRRGFEVMLGSMVAGSTALAPALPLIAFARWCDLDGPFLVAEDDAPSLAAADGRLATGDRFPWG